MADITLKQAREHYKKTDNKILDQCLEQLYPELKELNIKIENNDTKRDTKQSK
jgi:hypothetical protein